jgi:hypothetical protein
MNSSTPFNYAQSVSDGHVQKRRSYKMMGKQELRNLPLISWKVKHVLPETGLAMFYGRSGVGKSFLLLDLACAIANGTPWFGHVTKASPVIYVCLEGVAGFSSRVKAWEMGHNQEFPDNVFVIGEQFNFLDTENVGTLICSVTDLCKSLSPNMGTPVVIVDTLNRSMVGGDENGSKDMSLVWQACGHVTEITRGLVVLTHHSGKDAERGPRGHSSTIPTVDASIVVSRSKGQRTWESEKVKDGADKRTWTFGLETAILGVDGDGDEVTSCFISQGDEIVAVDDSSRPALSVHQTLALTILQSLGSAGASVSEKEWRERFTAQVAAKSDSGRRNAFNRVKGELIERKLIAINAAGGTVSEVGQSDSGAARACLIEGVA